MNNLLFSSFSVIFSFPLPLFHFVLLPPSVLSPLIYSLFLLFPLFLFLLFSLTYFHLYFSFYVRDQTSFISCFDLTLPLHITTCNLVAIKNLVKLLECLAAVVLVWSWTHCKICWISDVIVQLDHLTVDTINDSWTKLCTTSSSH